MSDLFSNLGIEWKVLLAQAVNFAILLFVLSKFVFKPIKKVLDKRAEEIKRTKENTELVAKKLAALEEEREKVLIEAREKSSEIVKEASRAAAETAQKIVDEAQSAALKVAGDERKKLALEKDKISQEIKKDIGELVAAALEKTAGDSIDANTRKKMLESAVQKINQNTK